MAHRLKWIVQYKCGCSIGPAYRRDILEYCGTHGANVQCKYPDLSVWNVRPKKAIKKRKTVG